MMVLELFPVVGVAGVLGPAVLWLPVQERLHSATILVGLFKTLARVFDERYVGDG